MSPLSRDGFPVLVACASAGFEARSFLVFDFLLMCVAVYPKQGSALTVCDLDANPEG